MQELVAQSLAPRPGGLRTPAQVPDGPAAALTGKKHRSSWRPFVCAFAGCKVRTRFRSEITRHLRIHTGERPCVCPFEGCRQAFARPAALRLHQRTHSTERPCVCTFADCGKAFGNRNTLHTHLRRHRGEKNFACSFADCNKRFLQRSALGRHLLAHGADKRFVCSQEGCRQAFGYAFRLRLHERLHAAKSATAPATRRQVQDSRPADPHQDGGQSPGTLTGLPAPCLWCSTVGSCGEHHGSDGSASGPCTFAQHALCPGLPLPFLPQMTMATDPDRLLDDNTVQCVDATGAAQETAVTATDACPADSDEQFWRALIAPRKSTSCEDGRSPDRKGSLPDRDVSDSR